MHSAFQPDLGTLTLVLVDIPMPRSDIRAGRSILAPSVSSILTVLLTVNVFNVELDFRQLAALSPFMNLQGSSEQDHGDCIYGYQTVV